MTIYATMPSTAEGGNTITKLQAYSPEWEVERIVRRIDAGENPFALSTTERIAASIIYDHEEWRPVPYNDLDAALKRLGEWRDATLNYCSIHGRRSWR